MTVSQALTSFTDRFRSEQRKVEGDARSVYRELIRSIAGDKPLSNQNHGRLVAAMEELGLAEADLRADIAVLQQHTVLLRDATIEKIEAAYAEAVRATTAAQAARDLMNAETGKAALARGQGEALSAYRSQAATIERENPRLFG